MTGSRDGNPISKSFFTIARGIYIATIDTLMEFDTFLRLYVHSVAAYVPLSDRRACCEKEKWMTIVRHGKTFVESSRGMRADLDYSKYPLGRRRSLWSLVPRSLFTAFNINVQGSPEYLRHSTKGQCKCILVSARDPPTLSRVFDKNLNVSSNYPRTWTHELCLKIKPTRRW